MTSKTTKIEVMNRLLEKIYCPNPADPDSCWLWMGALSSQGYATIGIDGKSWFVHRVSWVLHRGPIPAGLNVCHRCDTPPCWNPHHLFLGTQHDNIVDAVNKGRWPSRPHSIYLQRS